MIKYRIQVMESERGWGQDHWSEDYDTYEEAANRIKDINAQNTARSAPDWYMQAETKIETVEVEVEKKTRTIVEEYWARIND